MKVVDALHRFGGVASRSALIEATSRRAVDRALRRGHVVRDGHGRYALPTADAALRAANGLAAVLSLRSAAMYWGWEQKHPPTEPDLTVPHNRKVPAEKQRGAKVHWMDFQDGDVVLGT